MRKPLLLILLPFVLIYFIFKWLIKFAKPTERSDVKILGIFWRLQNYLQHYFFYYKHGFKESELWDLSCSLSRWIEPRLRAFKKLDHGFPGSISIDPETKNKIKLQNPDIEKYKLEELYIDECVKEWHSILDKIADFFKDYVENGFDDFYFDEGYFDKSEEECKKIKDRKYEGFDLLRNYFEHLVD